MAVYRCTKLPFRWFRRPISLQASPTCSLSQGTSSAVRLLRPAPPAGRSWRLPMSPGSSLYTPGGMRWGFGIQILYLVLDSFGEGANVGAYYETKGTATHVWFCMCEITRDISRLMIPGSDLITFRHRCATWLVLAVRSWDSLWEICRRSCLSNCGKVSC